MNEIQRGDVIELDFQERQISAIVLDPNGLQDGKPSVGLGLRMTELYIGIKHNTLSNWIDSAQTLGREEISRGLEWLPRKSLEAGQEEISTKLLRLPSGVLIPVEELEDSTGNRQIVIEANSWFQLAGEVAENPGKVREETRKKAIQFLRWFAVKGFYASCYTKLFGSYSEADDQLVTALQNRVNELEQLTNELANELAISEYHRDCDQYLIDELQRDMSWHRSNSWEGRDR